MRLKMAPNSLFAVLLRSSWWISVGIAVLFALAARALLPAEYWVFGALSGFPFLLIGLVAFPGAFAAKAIVDRLPLRVHTVILDGVVVTGGVLMILGAILR